MLSIDGFEFAIIGTGKRSGGEEVLVYDGFTVEEHTSVDDFEKDLREQGLMDRAPIFVYLDKEVRAEICRERKRDIVH